MRRGVEDPSKHIVVVKKDHVFVLLCDVAKPVDDLVVCFPADVVEQISRWQVGENQPDIPRT